MILWRPTKLAQAFREDHITEREQFSYLLVYVVLSLLFTDTYLNASRLDGPVNNYDALITVVTLAIGILGTWLCFKTSLKYPSKTGFLSRYICLSIPITVRLVATVLIALIVFTVLVLLISTFVIPLPNIERLMEPGPTTVFSVVFIVGFELIYFYYLNKMIDESYV